MCGATIWQCARPRICLLGVIAREHRCLLRACVCVFLSVIACAAGSFEDNLFHGYGVYTGASRKENMVDIVGRTYQVRCRCRSQRCVLAAASCSGADAALVLPTTPALWGSPLLAATSAAVEPDAPFPIRTDRPPTPRAAVTRLHSAPRSTPHPTPLRTPLHSAPRSPPLPTPPHPSPLTCPSAGQLRARQADGYRAVPRGQRGRV